MSSIGEMNTVGFATEAENMGKLMSAGLSQSISEQRNTSTQKSQLQACMFMCLGDKEQRVKQRQ